MAVRERSCRYFCTSLDPCSRMSSNCSSRRKAPTAAIPRLWLDPEPDFFWAPSLGWTFVFAKVTSCASIKEVDYMPADVCLPGYRANDSIAALIMTHNHANASPNLT